MLSSLVMTTPKRSEDNDVLGVSMPRELKTRIKALADADKRPMATWCAIHLEKLVEKMEAAASAKPPPPAPVSANSPPAAGLRKSDSIGQHSPEPVKKPNRHSRYTRS